MDLPHVRWVLRHHGVARPQVADGGDGLSSMKLVSYVDPTTVVSLSSIVVIYIESVPPRTLVK
jgi:hypothetical protein